MTLLGKLQAKRVDPQHIWLRSDLDLALQLFLQFCRHSGSIAGVGNLSNERSRPALIGRHSIRLEHFMREEIHR